MSKRKDGEQLEFMDVEEVATYLGVSISTVYRYIKDSDNPLPHFHILGKTLRVDRLELDRWLESYRNARAKA